MDATLIQAGLSLAETSIKQALQYDPASKQALAELGGRCLAIHISSPDITLFMNFMDNGEVRLAQHQEHDADTLLSGELSAFLNLARASDKQAALMKSDIHIKGSSQLAMSVANIMANLDIDFEAMVAKFTGPVAAHMLGKNLRKLGSWLKASGEKFKQDGVEYVRDELALAPHALEGEQRFSQIHKLKLDTERLQARIERLKQKIK